MNKKFIKSMVAAVEGLGVISSCSMMGSKDSHKCAGNKCASGKKMMEDSHKCASSAKKAEDNNTCGAKNGCAAAKTDAKSAKKAPAKKSN